ncbi:hypothetical protein CQW23_12294 [Capsicum baccatum]|uniref:Uncharacterized protein n=1 Tax=Capsicum baccatum TaxID=33114 RepID=A0A2G2WS53_CAPBA|nr:hypothetical protein CQW23_12294 [Capsicum baccatum]
MEGAMHAHRVHLLKIASKFLVKSSSSYPLPMPFIDVGPKIFISYGIYEELDRGAATTGVVGAAAGADTGVTGTTVGGAKAGAVAGVDGSNPVNGDIIVITGATLYAVSNVSEIKKAAFLTVYFVPTAFGPGVSEINAYFNGVDTPIMLGATTLLVKIIGSIGAVSIGLDLGKEEPLIHIGSYIVSLLGQGGSDNVNLAGIGSVTSTMIGTSEISSYMAHHQVFMLCSSSCLPIFIRGSGNIVEKCPHLESFLYHCCCLSSTRSSWNTCKSGSYGLFGRGGLIMFDASGVIIKIHSKISRWARAKHRLHYLVVL